MGFNIDRVLLDAVTIHHHGIWQEEIRLGYLISAKQCRPAADRPTIVIPQLKKGAAITRCRFDMSEASLQTCLFQRMAAERAR
jgi:hypothetical protein